MFNHKSYQQEVENLFQNYYGEDPWEYGLTDPKVINLWQSEGEPPERLVHWVAQIYELERIDENSIHK